MVFTAAKNVNFELSVDEFFMMTISKIMVPMNVIPRFSTFRNSFGDIREIFTQESI